MDDLPRSRILIHDLRQCLYAVHLALRVLERSREDDARFTEICGLIEKEEKRAGELIDALVQDMDAQDENAKP